MDVLFDTATGIGGSLGLITLNRPKALNALTLEMIRAIDPVLTGWAADPAIQAVVIRGAGDRAFCAGGDVRAVYEAGRSNIEKAGPPGLTSDFFREEYLLNRRIRRFPKPFVALIDGIVMGGGIGLSVHGSHRVCTERTLAAMPETGIGLFPDVGAGYVLSRLPGACGAWLALTGTRLKAADLRYLGLATSHVAAQDLEPLQAALAGADWRAGSASAVIDAILARYAADPGEAGIPALRPLIDRCFSADTVEAILAALDVEDRDAARALLHTLSGLSPTSLKVALEQIRRAATLSFDDSLVMEYRLSQSCMAGHDFYEGIRALLVDKDRSPKWKPATIDAVTREMVLAHFAQVPHGDLVFQD